jgi:membrane protease YdiL (CAAX protease family)
MFAGRLAALAEVLLILAAGNLLGAALYSLIAAPSVGDGTASELVLAAHSGFLILLRLGLAGALGFLLLFMRRRITPRQAGLGRNGQPLARLLGQGVILGLVSGFLISLLFLVHSRIPLGEGLPAWKTYSERPIDAAFWVGLLGTSVLIPPLVEEIMTRGYMRVRLVESYGTMAGVVLTSLVFGLSHARYLQADGMLLLFMAVLLVNSLMWTYLAQKTGSIIPPLVAHALSNGIGTAVLFNVWIPFLLVTIAVLLFIRPILATGREFFDDWRHDRSRGSLVQGIAIVLAVLAVALVLLGQTGRSITLAVLGGFCLIVTLVNLVAERSKA